MKTRYKERTVKKIYPKMGMYYEILMHPTVQRNRIKINFHKFANLGKGKPFSDISIKIN